jgi:hypothetical protein
MFPWLSPPSQNNGKKIQPTTLTISAATEMVSEDRRLRLSGYEVYRIGGCELMANTKSKESNSKKRVIQFFEDLFEKHQINSRCDRYRKSREE